MGVMMHRNDFLKIAVAIVFIAIVLVLFFMPRAAADDVSGFADVQEDGTLIISGHPVRLYGIYIPPTGHTCQTSIRPIPCGSRAQLALNFKIEGEFVHCTPIAENQDGSMTASCRVGSEDLSEWMLQRGWAVTLPGAPFSFAAMENIAKSRGIGVWGIPVEIPAPRR